MDNNTLYTEIGRMAYAVAKANGGVKDKEVEHVFNFIDEELKTGSSNAILYLGAEFTKLRRMNVSARDAFHMFSSFLENHSGKIHQSLKNLCLRLAIQIANADESVDETETAIIYKLRKKLEAA